MKTDWIQNHSRSWINPLHIERVYVYHDQDRWFTDAYMTSGASHHVYVGHDEDEAQAEAVKTIDKLQRYIRDTLHLH